MYSLRSIACYLLCLVLKYIFSDELFSLILPVITNNSMKAVHLFLRLITNCSMIEGHLFWGSLKGQCHEIFGRFFQAHLGPFYICLIIDTAEFSYDTTGDSRVGQYGSNLGFLNFFIIRQALLPPKVPKQANFRWSLQK